MMVLDTHVWVWWVHGDKRLSDTQVRRLRLGEADALGVSVISCWEVAKLVEYRRLTLPCKTHDGLLDALAYPGIVLLDLNVDIIVDATNLPGCFHRDPADQLIVATARHYAAPLVTSDAKLLNYAHVDTCA